MMREGASMSILSCKEVRIGRGRLNGGAIHMGSDSVLTYKSVQIIRESEKVTNIDVWNRGDARVTCKLARTETDEEVSMRVSM